MITNEIISSLEYYRNYLCNLRDKNLADFNKKLIPNQNLIIGINIPTLRNIAKEICKLDYEKVLKYPSIFHEEKHIKGLIIGYLKEDFQITINRLYDFSNCIDNWAIVDCTSTTLKTFKKNQKEGYSFIIDMINTNEEFKIRLGLVLLLFHYVNDDYIDNIIEIIKNIDHDAYYVKMANAWLICECYVKYKEKTNELFAYGLDKFTHNKSISKICDSFRVNNEDKLYLKTLRIK